MCSFMMKFSLVYVVMKRLLTSINNFIEGDVDPRRLIESEAMNKITIRDIQISLFCCCNIIFRANYSN